VRDEVERLVAGGGVFFLDHQEAAFDFVFGVARTEDVADQDRGGDQN
jgi:hypothetical protein